MKILFPALFLASLGCACGQGLIRQIHMVGGQAVVYDTTVTNDSGNVISRPLDTDVAVFQLYNTATVNGTTTFTKLDEKAVSTFLPVATVEVLSADPYSPARTRADQPYGIRLNVSGLQADSDEVPDYAKTVYMSRSYAMYDSTTFLSNGSGGVYADEFSFKSNGTFVDNNIIQRLPGDSPTLASGEESFTVQLHPDAGEVTELAKATVQIWPVAEAVIAGIVEGERYVQVPTTGRFSVINIYPTSVIYAQIYKGSQVDGTVGEPLPSTVVSYNSHQPQKAALTLTDLESFVDDDGFYTIEVLTITPFNDGAPEILGSVSFELKRTIRINGMMTTSE
ncbi:hypothetical protein [Luteolibacter sp. AS25]|uniref:hypothetical protein n=1 Tax=Luteolibacter sp. AS25 TaxID=3135776 RepID=UPI00398B42CD